MYWILSLVVYSYVWLQVLRVFGSLKFYEPRVIEKLLERDRGTGNIAMYVDVYLIVEESNVTFTMLYVGPFLRWHLILFVVQ